MVAYGTNFSGQTVTAGTAANCSFADAEAFALAKEHGTYFSMDVYNDDYILAEGEKNGTFKESLEKERAIGLNPYQRHLVLAQRRAASAVDCGECPTLLGCRGRCMKAAGPRAGSPG